MTASLPSHEILGEMPPVQEFERLVENYPSYKLDHRDALLRGFFQGKLLREIVEDKLTALGINVAQCSPLSRGGHARWVCEKIKKTIVRFLYLRYRCDEGLTRIQADQRLLQQFASDKAKDAGQSAIRKMTMGAKIDA